MKERLGMMVVLMVVVCLEVGMNTLNKVATTRGMSNFIFVLYSNALALLFLLPSTILYHRLMPPPVLTFGIFGRICITALLSYAGQTLQYIGIEYSSPTLASAMADLIPAFTFIFAVVAGMEILSLKERSSLAKSIGTIVLITGAFVITFYKGPPLLLFQHAYYNSLLPQQSNWILGSFILVTSSLFISMLFLVQAWILKDYPGELMLTVITCALVTILSAIAAMIAERNVNAWKLRPDMELIAICYNAIIMVGFRSVVYAWAVRKKGPVFVAMFIPLGMVAAVIMGVTFLRDDLYTGSVIGASIIALGFYTVMWGKAMEVKENIETNIDNSNEKVPLLPPNKGDSV
ncbi:PREDICTED: WAT1-related protein At3g28050-like [Ipomoea nil]|uniref:WAT1-related protein At3g28050-like n=1 Tax=Ipomoea nil TaxID=35883 RepID=UPI0009015E2D|nr:PREDICTED: WAT1-related protein At3g28050-like [Ipomoea nil]